MKGGGGGGGGGRAVVRLAPDQITRLDNLALRLRTENPGRSCSRAAVVRAIVARRVGLGRAG